MNTLLALAVLAFSISVSTSAPFKDALGHSADSVSWDEYSSLKQLQIEDKGESLRREQRFDGLYPARESYMYMDYLKSLRVQAQNPNRNILAKITTKGDDL